MGDHGDPLLRKRRIGGLRKTRVPLRIPGIEPMLSVVGRKKDVEVRIVGPEWKLHQQQGSVNQKGNQKNETEWKRTVGTVDEV